MGLCVMSSSVKWDPNSFQVHCADLDDHSSLLVLEDTIALAARHAHNIKKFCAVDHMIISSPGNTDTLDVDLVAECVLIFPDGICESCAQWWEVVLHGC
jgi:hypothetical protein